MAGPISESPSEPKHKKMPPTVARFQLGTSKEIQMAKACLTGEVKFEYFRNGLDIKTMSAADHKAWDFSRNLRQNTKYILKGI